MEKLIKELEETFSTFQSELNSVRKDKINAVPFEGSWTAGQLAQHIILATSGFGEVLNGPTGETSRPADEMVAKIKADFLNLDIKMDAPDFICPEKKEYHKEELLESLTSIKNDIASSAKDLDLTKTCLAFKLPVYGYLTRLEAINFVIAHTQRHVWQFKNINSKLELA
ncbi:DinB family protein [Pedobacter paludis]|uniref:DinB family protein n=1 Tax=Pedobacter paludis TaxID=2203212 RepID=A0A317EWY8_9SPHI|nr:DinB family protein [Pedobacter paludis]PWS30357.1 DinB family protein [Pedobacter paludis]